MNKEQITAKIKETEDQLASLRKQLEEPEYPTLANSKPGDKLENGCIVVHKMEDIRMALIAAPDFTEISCQWSKDFNRVFTILNLHGFNRSEWFIPNVEQLKLAYVNCRQHFKDIRYWSSTEFDSNYSCGKNFSSGSMFYHNKNEIHYTRAFSLVSY